MSPTESQTVLITGAAGAIGSATASIFLEAGMTVVGIDKLSSGHDTGTGDRYVALTTDLTDEDGLVESLDVLAEVPELRHVVGIAGGALPGEPESQDDPSLIDTSKFRESLEQNLTSQFILLKATLPWLLKPHAVDRSVTLTSSFNALAGYGMPAYSAAKAGLSGLMNSLVGPLGHRGIRINCVAPGTIRTPRTERIWSHVPDHFDQLAKSAALGRIGEPVDVGKAFRALALEMTHVTGHTLVVDGGQLVYRS